MRRFAIWRWMVRHQRRMAGAAPFIQVIALTIVGTDGTPFGNVEKSVTYVTCAAHETAASRPAANTANHTARTVPRWRFTALP